LTIDKPKPIIQKLEFTEEQKEDIKNILLGCPTDVQKQKAKERGVPLKFNPHKGCVEGRIYIVKKKYKIGECQICRELSDYKLTYQFDGASLREWYCSKHFPSEVSKSN